MTIWCLIPARGGSRGLPGKNLARVGGLSLVARAVLAARTFAVDAALTDIRIIVDTDDAGIAAEGRAFGAEVPFLRNAELAGDCVGTVDTILGFFARLGQGADDDMLILLQPTSPLRTADEIALVWHAASQPNVESAATVVPTAQPLDLALDMRTDGTLTWRAGDASDGRRRQDSLPTMHLTGAVYATRIGALRRSGQFVVSGVTVGVPVDERRSVDIDTAADLAVAHALARAESAAAVMLGGRTLAMGHPVFVIADASVNHDGQPVAAHALIDAAADAGADAVKFQVFDPQAAPHHGAPSVDDPSRHALALPAQAWPGLVAHAARRRIMLLATPFDSASADLLVRSGITALKVPSTALADPMFLRDLARRGVPLLLSTGMGTMAEIASALLEVRASGNPSVVLMHSVSAYPAPAAECNLAAMSSLAAAFSVPVGWSDRTPDGTACLAAAALGATVIEKQLTLDRQRVGPHHGTSLEPQRFAMLVSQIRTVSATIGDGQKRPMPSELGRCIAATPPRPTEALIA